MAIEVGEQLDSQRVTGGENSSEERRYWVMGTDDKTSAVAAMLAYAPAAVDGLVYKTHELEHDADTNELWFGSVTYGPFKEDEEEEEGDESETFDTGGGTAHITQSLDTVNSYAPPGENAPDFKGAIGVTVEGVEGVDITVPVYNFSITKILGDATVTAAYKALLFARTGQVNNAGFRGFSAGEVIFLGAAGAKRGEEDWEISFSFAASPNVTGLTVGDIVNIEKKGWEYLWVRYAEEKDDVAKMTVRVPIAAFVEKVYEQGNFGDIGIST